MRAPVVHSEMGVGRTWTLDWIDLATEGGGWVASSVAVALGNETSAAA